MSYYYESNDGHFFLKNKNGEIKRISKELFFKKKINHSGGLPTSALAKRMAAQLFKFSTSKAVPKSTSTGSTSTMFPQGTSTSTGSTSTMFPQGMPEKSSQISPTTNRPSNRKTKSNFSKLTDKLQTKSSNKPAQQTKRNLPPVRKVKNKKPESKLSNSANLTQKNNKASKLEININDLFDKLENQENTQLKKNFPNISGFRDASKPYYNRYNIINQIIHNITGISENGKELIKICYNILYQTKEQSMKATSKPINELVKKLDQLKINPEVINEISINQKLNNLFKKTEDCIVRGGKENKPSKDDLLAASINEENREYLKIPVTFILKPEFNETYLNILFYDSVQNKYFIDNTNLEALNLKSVLAYYWNNQPMIFIKKPQDLSELNYYLNKFENRIYNYQTNDIKEPDLMYVLTTDLQNSEIDFLNTIKVDVKSNHWTYGKEIDISFNNLFNLKNKNLEELENIINKLLEVQKNTKINNTKKKIILNPVLNAALIAYKNIAKEQTHKELINKCESILSKSSLKIPNKSVNELLTTIETIYLFKDNNFFIKLVKNILENPSIVSSNNWTRYSTMRKEVIYNNNTYSNYLNSIIIQLSITDKNLRIPILIRDLNITTMQDAFRQYNQFISKNLQIDLLNLSDGKMDNLKKFSEKNENLILLKRFYLHLASENIKKALERTNYLVNRVINDISRETEVTTAIENFLSISARECISDHSMSQWTKYILMAQSKDTQSTRTAQKNRAEDAGFGRMTGITKASLFSKYALLLLLLGAVKVIGEEYYPNHAHIFNILKVKRPTPTMRLTNNGNQNSSNDYLKNIKNKIERFSENISTFGEDSFDNILDILKSFGKDKLGLSDEDFTKIDYYINIVSNFKNLFTVLAEGLTENLNSSVPTNASELFGPLPLGPLPKQRKVNDMFTFNNTGKIIDYNANTVDVNLEEEDSINEQQRKLREKYNEMKREENENNNTNKSSRNLNSSVQMIGHLPLGPLPERKKVNDMFWFNNAGKIIDYNANTVDVNLEEEDSINERQRKLREKYNEMKREENKSSRNLNSSVQTNDSELFGSLPEQRKLRAKHNNTNKSSVSSFWFDWISKIQNYKLTNKSGETKEEKVKNRKIFNIFKNISYIIIISIGDLLKDILRKKLAEVTSDFFTHMM